MNELGRRKITALKRERRRLLDELPKLDRLLRGSFFERLSTCSRPSCPCHQGQRHGPRAYVAVTAERGQRQYYVPKSQLQAVRDGVGQYHRLLAIVDRVTAINLELMRGGALDDSPP
jgi:hypothetical protein